MPMTFSIAEASVLIETGPYDPGFIHVATLRSLHAISGLQGLKEYADKWDGYIDRWPTMEPYKNADIQLTRYDAEKSN